MMLFYVYCTRLRVRMLFCVLHALPVGALLFVVVELLGGTAGTQGCAIVRFPHIAPPWAIIGPPLSGLGSPDCKPCIDTEHILLACTSMPHSLVVCQF